MVVNNEKILKTIGETIRKVRKAQGLTQAELAKSIGLNRNYIGMIERGERNPSFLSLFKIISGLKMTVPQFFSNFTL